MTIEDIIANVNRILAEGFEVDASRLKPESHLDKDIGLDDKAVADAGVNAGDIDYINAHATSTPLGDLAEARAIAEVFGLSASVSSTKAMTGHECWMAGASEVVYTALMARDGFIAPNINFTRLDDGCPPIRIVAETLPARIRLAMSNSFGFGGTNAVLVLDFRSGGMDAGRTK